MLEMLHVSPFGAVHTIISLIAVAAGLIALIRDREISPRNAVGKTYIIATIFTCLTGFFIFHHGGISPGHILGVVTLLVLGLAAVAGRTVVFGRVSRAVETVSYSLTFFFHMIPTINETATRFPLGAPLAASAEDPRLKAAAGGVFLLFIIGAMLQVRRLKAGEGPRREAQEMPSSAMG